MEFFRLNLGCLSSGGRIERVKRDDCLLGLCFALLTPTSISWWTLMEQDQLRHLTRQMNIDPTPPEKTNHMKIFNLLDIRVWGRPLSDIHSSLETLIWLIHLVLVHMSVSVLVNSHMFVLCRLCAFCHARHQLHVFPHLAPVACFPALGTGCMISFLWHRLHVFPCFFFYSIFRLFVNSLRLRKMRSKNRYYNYYLTPVACFPTLGTSFMFFCVRHRLHYFCIKFWLVHCIVSVCCDWLDVNTLVLGTKAVIKKNNLKITASYRWHGWSRNEINYKQSQLILRSTSWKQTNDN